MFSAPIQQLRKLITDYSKDPTLKLIREIEILMKSKEFKMAPDLKMAFPYISYDVFFNPFYEHPPEHTSIKAACITTSLFFTITRLLGQWNRLSLTDMLVAPIYNPMHLYTPQPILFRIAHIGHPQLLWDFFAHIHTQINTRYLHPTFFEHAILQARNSEGLSVLSCMLIHNTNTQILKVFIDEITAIKPNIHDRRDFLVTMLRGTWHPQKINKLLYQLAPQQLSIMHESKNEEKSSPLTWNHFTYFNRIPLAPPAGTTASAWPMHLPAFSLFSHVEEKKENKAELAPALTTPAASAQFFKY